MAKFNYVAMDSTGKETKGVLEVGSQAEALNRLKEMGFLPTKVTEVVRPSPMPRGPRAARGPRARPVARGARRARVRSTSRSPDSAAR